MHILKLMRPHHYIKNGLLFLPLVFSQNLTNLALLTRVILGFIIFSLLSSVVYIINDINDASNDKNHAIKKTRPIASGAVSQKQAIMLAISLFIIICILNYCLNTLSISSWIILALYFAINVLYSFGLKNYPILDISILASGFLLRVLYGSVITDILVSNWLYLTVISLSFYLSLGKRRNELTLHASTARNVLSHYSYNFLDKNMYFCMALANVFYSLWCIDKSNQPGSALGSYIIWSVPLVIIICMKYSLTIESGSEGDPVDVLLKDKLLLALVFIYIVFMCVMIYI